MKQRRNGFKFYPRIRYEKRFGEKKIEQKLKIEYSVLTYMPSITFHTIARITKASSKLYDHISISLKVIRMQKKRGENRAKNKQKEK